MKPEIKRRWLKALRSGRYKQCHSTLKSDDGGYCCLGVLTQLYLTETRQKWKESEEGFGVLDVSGDINTGDLAASVRKWARLKKADPKVWVPATEDDPRTKATLSSCNDDYQMNFRQIADAIEKSL